MIDSDRCEECGFDYANPTDGVAATVKLCPGCGAVGRRHVSIHVTDSATVHEYLGMKVQRAGEKKPYIEAQLGEQLSVRTGRWMTKRRVIDRDADWYEERVVDPESGAVVHECSERLSEHCGHGSARGTKHRSCRAAEVQEAAGPDVAE